MINPLPTFPKYFPNTSYDIKMIQEKEETKQKEKMANFGKGKIGNDLHQI